MEIKKIEFLKSIAKRKLSRESIKIYKVKDLIKLIAQKKDSKFSKEELMQLLLDVNESSKKRN